MRFFILCILSALALVHCMDYACPKGNSKTKTVTLSPGDSYTFNTNYNDGDTYLPQTKCSVVYKAAKNCKKGIKFSCSSFDLPNMDTKNCRKGDELILGKEAYCGDTTPNPVTLTGKAAKKGLKVMFTSDKKTAGSGAQCTAMCLDGAVTPAPTTTTLASSSVTPQSSMEKKIKEIESTLNNTITYVQSLEKELADKDERLDNMTVRGRWCATRKKWTTEGQITYDKIFFSDTNMDITVTPLNINSGIFVVPATGTWRVNYSIFSIYCLHNFNIVNLYHRGLIVGEMVYNTVADTNCGWSTGGREAFFHAEKSETFYLRTPSAGAVHGKGLNDIMICFEYLNGFS